MHLLSLQIREVSPALRERSRIIRQIPAIQSQLVDLNSSLLRSTFQASKPESSFRSEAIEMAPVMRILMTTSDKDA